MKASILMKCPWITLNPSRLQGCWSVADRDLWPHCGGTKENREKDLGKWKRTFLFLFFFPFEDKKNIEESAGRNRGGDTGFNSYIGETGMLGQRHCAFISAFLSSVFLGSWGMRIVRGKFGFVVVCCSACQSCFDWAFMPVSSKALLRRDMQLEIDRWVDKDRQPTTQQLTTGKQKGFSV